jgi:hypothetical protein
MQQEQLTKAIGTLFSVSLKVASPVGQLHLIREKIMARGYKEFDKKDILDELGRLQHIAGELHREMVSIHNTLNGIK